MDERGKELALYIASGMHEGARTRVHENVKYRMGAAVDGDIVLRDEGIADCHVTLEVSEGCVRLEALADNVLIDGLRKLPPGHIAESRLPCRFSLADVHVRLDGTEGGDGRSGRILAPGAASGWQGLGHYAWGLALVCVAVLVVYLVLPGVTGSQQAQAKSGGHAIAPVAVPAAQAVGQDLQAHLQTAGLNGMSVAVEGNIVQVKGALPDHLKPRWQAAQEWFDRHYGSHYVLRSTVTPMPAPQVVITAVWLGEHPYLIDGDGERHYQGAFLKDGWLLQSIEDGRIVLSRNGQEHVFGL